MENPGFLIFTQGSVYPSCLVAGSLEKARGSPDFELSRETSDSIAGSALSRRGWGLGTKGRAQEIRTVVGWV